MTGPGTYGVSVVVPCFDAEATVAEALDSALAQSCGDLEVIAVDDGSRDRTGEILREYRERFPERIRVLHGRHAGPYVARNLAAREARGAFLAFLDADDLWESSKLEKQVALMRARPEVVLCHTGGTMMQADGTPLRVFPAHPDYRGYCFPRMLVRNRIATSSVMLRRAFFRELGGFDESFPARGDWELWTRVAQHGELAAVDEPLIRYRLHEGRMSRDTDRMRRYHLRIIEKHAKVYRSTVADLERYISASRFHAHMAYGSEYLAAGRRNAARSEALRAIREKPTALRAWKLLGRSVLGPERVDRLRGRGDPGPTPASGIVSTPPERR